MSAVILSFIVARLREPSTWAGLAVLVQSAAVAIVTPSPEAIGAAVAAAVAILKPDARS